MGKDERARERVDGGGWLCRNPMGGHEFDGAREKEKNQGKTTGRVSVCQHHGEKEGDGKEERFQQKPQSTLQGRDRRRNRALCGKDTIATGGGEETLGSRLIETKNGGVTRG